MYNHNYINNYVVNNVNINNTMNVHNSKILDLIKKEKVITSSELAKYLKINWNTADKYLMELAMINKVERIKKEGVNLWMLK